MEIIQDCEFEKFPPLLDVPTTAKLLNVTRQHVYNQIKLGLIPHVHVGKKVLVPRDLLITQLLCSSNDMGVNL